MPFGAKTAHRVQSPETELDVCDQSYHQTINGAETLGMLAGLARRRALSVAYDKLCDVDHRYPSVVERSRKVFAHGPIELEHVFEKVDAGKNVAVAGMRQGVKMTQSTTATSEKLSVVEAGMKSDDELTELALAAYSRIVADRPDLLEEPGVLAETIDAQTGVGFETAAFVTLSGPRSRP